MKAQQNIIIYLTDFFSIIIFNMDMFIAYIKYTLTNSNQVNLVYNKKKKNYTYMHLCMYIYVYITIKSNNYTYDG